MSDLTQYSTYQKLVIKIIGAIGALILWLLSKSLRWKHTGLDPEQLINLKSSGILAFWHGQQLMAPHLYIHYRAKMSLPDAWVLISAHKDGRMIAEAVSWFGIKSVAGSSTRGGKEALLALQTKLSATYSFAIFTPDGPKGPIFKSKPGVISLASKLSIPIFPFAFSFSKFHQFSSWDKMILPYPFSKAVMHIGQPFYVPKDLTEEQFKDYMETFDQLLNKTSAEAAQEVQK